MMKRQFGASQIHAYEDKVLLPKLDEPILWMSLVIYPYVKLCYKKSSSIPLRRSRANKQTSLALCYSLKLMSWDQRDDIWTVETL
jgi:hypothetical protein